MQFENVKDVFIPLSLFVDLCYVAMVLVAGC